MSPASRRWQPRTGQPNAAGRTVNDAIFSAVRYAAHLAVRQAFVGKTYSNFPPAIGL